ncbi:MAG: response regulator [Desulfococcaceae bacterium]
MNSPQILLVDDEPIVGNRLKNGLEKMGCDVEVFKDAEAALARIREKKIDIVITDIMMPEINGLEVLETVKDVDPDIRVIIITGFATSEMAREAMEKGAYDIIAKPFRPVDLRAMVAKAANELGFANVKSDMSAQ